MARDVYVWETRREKSRLRSILILLLTLILLLCLAAGIFLLNSRRRANEVIQEFEHALSEDRGTDALAVYRDALSRSRSNAFYERNQDRYTAAARQMEALVAARIAAWEKVLIEGGRLSDSQVALAGDLNEMTSAQVIAWLRGLSRDYLLGRIELPVLERSIQQLGGLPNIKPSLGDLGPEIQQMTKIRPAVLKAGALRDAQDWWAAWQAYTDILADKQMAGVVQQAVSEQFALCTTRMKEPLQQDIRALIEGGRLMTAQKELARLQTAFPDDLELRRMFDEIAAKIPAGLENYRGTVEYIVIKPLIVNPAKAFDQGRYAAIARDAMLTTGEFKRLLDQLYSRQYILVDGDRLYGSDRQPTTLRLPPGKKPLVLVLETANYYVTRRETGNVWDLILDETGQVCAQIPDADGNLQTVRDAEAISILDDFVKAHPDFALDGAKGTITLTGYECIFGQVINADQLDDRNKALAEHQMPTLQMTEEDFAAARKRVQAIIDRLKKTGWIFGSSTYGYIDASSADAERLRLDTEKWMDQVGSLTGPVSILHYPNGLLLRGSDPRAEYLKDQGFILFGGLGPTPYVFVGNRYIYVDKTPINGMTLKQPEQYKLGRFLDAAAVLSNN